MISEKFVALWSHSQKAFHVETVSEMLRTNWRGVANNIPLDYIPIAFGTHQECSEFITSLKQRMEEFA